MGCFRWISARRQRGDVRVEKLFYLSLTHTPSPSPSPSPSHSISHISSGIGDCEFVLWLWWCIVDCDDALQTTGIPPNLNPHASALGQKGSRHQQPGEGTGLVAALVVVVVVVVVVAAAWSVMSSP